MMVLFTAYLNDGEPPAGEDSEIRDRRIEFYGEEGGQDCRMGAEGNGGHVQ